MRPNELLAWAAKRMPRYVAQQDRGDLAQEVVLRYLGRAAKGPPIRRWQAVAGNALRWVLADHVEGERKRQERPDPEALSAAAAPADEAVAAPEEVPVGVAQAMRCLGLRRRSWRIAGAVQEGRDRIAAIAAAAEVRPCQVRALARKLAVAMGIFLR